ALLAVVVLGAGLRVNGVDWDQPHDDDVPQQMHPDERFLSLVAGRIAWPSGPGEYFDTSTSPLNPYNSPDNPSFVYGTFPLFLVKGAATLARADVPAVSATADRLFCAGAMARKHPGTGSRYSEYETTVVCGRRVTALFDTATIIVLFGLGALLFGRVSGLLAAFLYAVAVLPTQLAHFWAVDPYVVFFGTATLLLSVLTVRNAIRPPPALPVLEAAGARLSPWADPARDAQLRAAALCLTLGLCIGLGLASKVTAWPLTLSPFLAACTMIGLRDFPRLGLRWGGVRQRMTGRWSTDVSVLCLTFLIAIIVFRIAQPYAFQGPHFWDMQLNPQWRADIEREIDYQKGNVDNPPFVAWAGRAPFAWPLQNLVLYGLGPTLGIVAWAASAVAVVLLFRKRELTFLLPLATIVAVTAFQGPRFVAYMRYFAPMYPALCLFAAWGIVALVRHVRAATGHPAPGPQAGLFRLLRHFQPGSPVFRRAVYAAAGVLLLGTVWWALAFQSLYSGEHPRIAASRWLYENVPPGSTVTGEYWDDTLPYPLRGYDQAAYPLVQLYPYDTDSAAKVEALVFGRIERDPTLGLNGADYVAITSNRIRSSVGRLEREYPATIRFYELLDSGELGFRLVAHFQNKPTFLGLSIDDSGAEESFTVYDHPEVRIYQKTAEWDATLALSLLMDAHPDRAVNLLPRQGRTNGLQFTAAEAATQQSGGTFSSLFSSDGLTSHVPWLWWLLWLEVAAFATVPWMTWLFRALPDRGFGLSKLAGFIAVGLGSWMLVAWGAFHFSGNLAWGVFGAVAVAGYITGYLRRRSLIQDFRDHWRSWAAAEAVFLAAFFVVLALRYNNPDLWHHPQGGEKPIELAYLTAVARSTILPPFDPWFGGGTMNYYYMGWFLVAVPIRALRMLPEVGFNIGLATYAGLAASVAFSTVHNLVALSARRREGARRWPKAAIVAGLAGVFLFIGLGNLDGGHQLIERLQALNLAREVDGQPVYHWSLFSDTPFLGGLVGLLSGLYRWLFEGAAMPPFDWWRSSRVHIGSFDITEFPYWSFLFGDLHAHVMGLPFFGLVIALVVAYVVSAARGLRRQALVLAAAMGVALGLVRTVQTWDFPSAVLLAAAAIAAGQLLRPGRWQERWWDAAGHLALAAGVLLVAFSPYTSRFEVFETGLVRARETTPTNQYFAHFGLFFTILAAFLAVRYREELISRDWKPGRDPILATLSGPLELGALLIFLAGLGAFTWRFGLSTIAFSLCALILLFHLLWLEYRAAERDTPRLLATAIFAAAVGIAGGVDVVGVKFDIVRMNTVFKFSLQAWQLYAVAGGYGLWYVAAALYGFEGRRLKVLPGRRLVAVVATAVIGTLIFSAAIFPWSGTRARQEARFAGSPSGTLDGLAYLPYGTYPEDRGTDDPADDRLIALGEDEPLIRWLRDNVQGSPVIAEAVGPLYHWTGRISWNTGLPAVIGWDWHQVQQRLDYEPLIQQRRIDMTNLYRTPDPGFVGEVVARYNVRYIVVGTEETVMGTPEGLAKFDGIPWLEPVFESGPYRIYEVRR
ncbi:MAG: DUF2298 domain-containing protein, partial [Dehalococcoidia bacterium]